MLIKHLKHVTIDLHYTDKEFDFTIDVIIKINNDYYSNYHIKSVEDLPSILKTLPEYTN